MNVYRLTELRLIYGSPTDFVKRSLKGKGFSYYTPSLLSDSLSQSQQEHRIILECVLNRDREQIRQAVEQHILGTQDRLIEFMNEGSGS